MTSPVGTGPTPTLVELLDREAGMLERRYEVMRATAPVAALSLAERARDLRAAAQRLREVHANALVELEKAERNELECLAAMNRGILFATVQVNAGPLNNKEGERHG